MPNTKAPSETKVSKATNGASADNTSDAIEALRAILEGKPLKSKEYRNVTVRREGEQIIIPEHMTYPDARKWLEVREEEEEKVVVVRHDIECFPLDGAVALQKAIERIYGFAAARGQRGFFGEQPPRFLSVPVGPDEHMEVAWDNFQPPALEGGVIATQIGGDGSKPIFRIYGQLKKKHQHAVKVIADLVREILRTESIYRGQAISVDLGYARGERNFNLEADAPRYMGLKNISESDLILNDDADFALATSVYARVQNTEACVASGVPLKHGTLLMGPYGTGKTLTAKVIAAKCVANGWTFIYVKDSRQIAEALHFASMYAPAVVFAEDIDKAVKGERDSEMDRILNTLDGIDTKDKPIVTVLTTNHPESIHSGFLRAGRIDTAIYIGEPDAKAALRFIDLYARDASGASRLVDDEDYTEAGAALQGFVPAFIAEAVNRAKMYAMHREGGDANARIAPRDIELAAASLRNHKQLMEDNSVTPSKSTYDDLMADIAARSAKMLEEKYGDEVENAVSKLTYIYDQM